MTLIDFKLNLVIWYMTAPIYAGCVASSFTGAITRIVAATITTIHTTPIVASGCSLGFNKRYTCHNSSTNYRQSRFGCLLEELTTRLEFLVLLWVRHKNLSFFCIGTPAMRVKNGEIGCVHTRDNTKDIDIKKAWEFSWCRSHSWGSRIAYHLRTTTRSPRRYK